ncbi:MAG: gamma-glutamyl-gamma-aminobutyrate hydrolase family protein [Lactobacillales bacterium]|jgi:putative glutamine amidotransferase|nr:gamma-glutamyl-gamma-aminobutyrate hydrolase family protein [Lactobacillales bacterium]
MNKPIIGIAATQLDEYVEELYNSQVHYAQGELVEAIRAAGGIPLILPIGIPIEAVEYVSHIDKLILAGGHDVDPMTYDEEPHPLAGSLVPKRDFFEIELVHEMRRQKKPIMSICRGTQLLNIALGGTVWQDLSLRPEETTVKHNQAPTRSDVVTHSVFVEEDSELAKIIGENILVNSFHHQAIHKVGHGLRAVAWSHDEVIEALEGENILAVQWHPELAFKTNENDFEIFKHFIKDM